VCCRVWLCVRVCGVAVYAVAAGGAVVCVVCVLSLVVGVGVVVAGGDGKCLRV